MRLARFQLALVIFRKMSGSARPNAACRSGVSLTMPQRSSGPSVTRTWKRRETRHCFGVLGETVALSYQRPEEHCFSEDSELVAQLDVQIRLNGTTPPSQNVPLPT